MEKKEKRVYKIVLTGGTKQIPLKTRQRVGMNEWERLLLTLMTNPLNVFIYRSLWRKNHWAITIMHVLRKSRMEG